MKQILCVLIIDKRYVPLHITSRKEGDGAGRPTAAEEEALSKAHAIWSRGVAEGCKPAIVWQMFLSRGSPSAQLGEHHPHLEGP